MTKLPQPRTFEMKGSDLGIFGRSSRAEAAGRCGGAIVVAIDVSRNPPATPLKGTREWQTIPSVAMA